jgi:o-succinylbenzoate synthase
LLHQLQHKTLQQLTAEYRQHDLIFKKPGGTSRGVLTTKTSYFFIVHQNGKTGIGECGLLKGLSCDDVPEYETVLKNVCHEIERYEYWLNEGLISFPSIRFGLEMALFDLVNGGNHVLFPSAFTEGKASIRINGLIWMGSKDEMKTQIEAKLNEGFKCLKLKIGAIDFDEEIALLKFIRQQFSVTDLELRVDANGAFEPEDALNKLQQLSAFDIHSIEQPIKAGQWEAMAELCESTTLPIALDEELIGINNYEEQHRLMLNINPQYIILKPSLLGGFAASQQWIDIANEMKTDWRVTSALESNIGLNAIAQWTFTLKNLMPQGLGTGQLYTNNFESPLYLKGENLYYSSENNWNISFTK